MNENTSVLERPQKLTDINTKNDIINRLANEEPGTHIARTYQVDRSRISQIKSANEELIKQKKAELIAKLPSVIETVAKDIKTNSRLSTNLSDNIDNLTVPEKLQFKTILDKTSVNILKIAGIVQSQALINLTQNNDNRQQTTLISDKVLNLFTPHARELIEAEAVDTNEDTSNDGDSDNA